jgi:hypothetical protein
VSHRVVEIIARNSLKTPELLKENRETEKIIPFPHFRHKFHRELPRSQELHKGKNQQKTALIIMPMKKNYNRCT